MSFVLFYTNSIAIVIITTVRRNSYHYLCVKYRNYLCKNKYYVVLLHRYFIICYFQINYTTEDNTRKEDGSIKNDSEHKCSETFQGIVARADPGSYFNQM